MKIVCDSCGTKYSISDDKVRGKVFKIRCKKCSHIIVVRGTNEAAAAAAPTPAAAAAPADGGWHLVVEGDQVGPVPESDIRGRIERGEINAETYVWKEGFADWLKLSAIPEFAQLVTPADGGVFADGSGSGAVNGDAAAHQPAAGGLFGGAAAGDDADVFGGLAPAATKRGGGGGDLFASPAMAAKQPAAEESRWPAASASPGGHDGGRVESLTGQRHENSVLFSLSNLQSLAMPAPAAAKSISTTAPTSEGSGLIDIRAMAATTLGSSGSAGPSFGGGSPADDLPAFGAFSPAAPVLLALPTNSGPPKWIYAVIGVAVLLVVAIGVMAFKILGAKPVTAVETAAAPTAAAPGAPAPAASAPVAANTPPPAAPTTIPDKELPPREAPSAAAAAPAAATKSEHSEHHRHGKESAAGSSKKGGDEGKKAAEAPSAPAPVAEKKPKAGSLDDLLEGALNHKPAGGGAAPKPRVDDDARKADTGGGGPIARGAVVAGMNSVKGKISDCYQQFKVPGMAMVNVVIGKSGRVSSATVTGKFAGTPTGACVEKAVKSASFPPSDGLTTPYPFQLK